MRTRLPYMVAVAVICLSVAAFVAWQGRGVLALAVLVIGAAIIFFEVRKR